MISSDYVLELSNVFYSGQVEPGSCVQRLLGSIKTGVILKDVSMTVHSGEVMAILGSKGSGKKALLDVISRRIQTPTRGQVLLNNQPMSLSLFQQRCGYVTHKCDLLPGLTVEQTLYFTPTIRQARMQDYYHQRKQHFNQRPGYHDISPEKCKSWWHNMLYRSSDKKSVTFLIGMEDLISTLTGYLKKSKVKQVMADLALSQVANTCTENLTQSEYRRLMIGVQLIKDPVVLLLDEPTWDLDPLNTYLVISILSNASKKYGTAVILTMEKPRSDVFPFLERVLYLCLGDVVYTGGTRQMLEYFNAIGFPCPQLENPLMYYLCLSTVDRRSRERFLESNHQIAALVEKFKIEGGAFRKESVIGANNALDPAMGHGNKVPLLLGKPSRFQTGWTLYSRLIVATISLRKSALKQMFLRLFLLPLFYLLLWIFYREMKNYQHTFISRSGLIFNCQACAYFAGILNAIFLYPIYRTRYFQESQEGLYGGTLFLLTYNFVSIPFSFISTAGACAIIYPLIGTYDDPLQYLYFTLILWACYIFTEQQTMAILMVISDHLSAAIFSIYIACVSLTLSSGFLRSIKGLQDWLYYLTYATQVRYAAAFLNRQTFLTGELHETLPYDMKHNCTNLHLIETSGSAGSGYCRYINGQEFLSERYTRDSTDLIFSGILDFDMNIGITFAFSVGMIIFNLFLYLLPLPAFIKAKFRE